MTIESDYSGLGFKPGSCPVRPQNKESFEKYSMAGLWFEYVWEQGYQQQYDYLCSTWIVLSDEADSGPGRYVVYNNMVKRIGEDDDDVQEGDSEFIKFNFIWDEQPEDGPQRAQATFDRVNDEPTAEEYEANDK